MGKQKSPQARMARTVPVRQLYGVHLRKRPEGQQPEPADHEQHDTAYRGGTAQERPKIGTMKSEIIGTGRAGRGHLLIRRGGFKRERFRQAGGTFRNPG